MNRSSLQVLVLGFARRGGSCRVARSAAIVGSDETGRRAHTRSRPSTPGWSGKDFAVVVSADRMIRLKSPDIVQYLTGEKITERWRPIRMCPAPLGVCARGGCAAVPVRTPGLGEPTDEPVGQGPWGRQAAGVHRNGPVPAAPAGRDQYEWDGVASGTVSVIELDWTCRTIMRSRAQIIVKFPDKTGMGPSEIPSTP